MSGPSGPIEMRPVADAEDTSGNIDGGNASSVFGGIDGVDGGGA